MPKTAPEPPGRIKPADLRVECQACGGQGTVSIPMVEKFPLIKQVHVTYRSEQCARCLGNGTVFPGKVDL